MKYTVPEDALTRGHDFVQQNGSELMKALAGNALGVVSGDDVLPHFEDYHNNDGGWKRFDADLRGELSTISQTWVGLQWLLWTRPSDSAPLDRTIDFLSRSQNNKGYWDEPEEILKYDPPPWMLPNVLGNQLWLTSAVGCKLIELGRETEVRYNAAVEFLRRGWDGNRFPVQQHTHWMAANLFSRLSEPTDIDRRIAAGSIKRLINDITAGAVDATDMTAIAYAAFRSGARDLFDLSFPKVVANQAEDGGWTTEYGDRHRPQGTVEAMHLLKMVSESALLHKC